jgi:hypothetical protein
MMSGACEGRENGDLKGRKGFLHSAVYALRYLAVTTYI